VSGSQTNKPFNQKLRIWTLRALALVFLPVIIFTEPTLARAPSFYHEITETLGELLVIVGVLGRFWSILYIGGKKNVCIIDSGPYSICRHPLYLFSTIGVLGFGVMNGSVIVMSALVGSVLLVLSLTAKREERDLIKLFGGEYAKYAERVPMIIPRWFFVRTELEVTFNSSTLRTNLFDCFVFLLLIPIAQYLDWARSSYDWPVLSLL
jgi:protein-S-isoprenylcysteine O-methyltransferase Ste14